jgi:hypothetical protein
MVKNMDIHNHNTQKKLNLNVQHCNTVPFKKSVINMDISLYSKVPGQIKLRGILNLFKKDLKSFLLNHSFYSLEEFMVPQATFRGSPVENGCAGKLGSWICSKWYGYSSCSCNSL